VTGDWSLMLNNRESDTVSGVTEAFTLKVIFQMPQCDTDPTNPYYHEEEITLHTQIFECP
jgi:hypothetical protein